MNDGALINLLIVRFAERTDFEHAWHADILPRLRASDVLILDVQGASIDNLDSICDAVRATCSRFPKLQLRLLVNASQVTGFTSAFAAESNVGVLQNHELRLPQRLFNIASVEIELSPLRDDVSLAD